MFLKVMHSGAAVIHSSTCSDRAWIAGDDGKIVRGGFRAQGEQAFANLNRALEAGGSSLNDVVKVTIFVTDMGNFKEVVDLRRQFFSEPYPADTIAEVGALYDPQALIEIEAIAVASDRSGILTPLADLENARRVQVGV